MCPKHSQVKNLQCTTLYLKSQSWHTVQTGCSAPHQVAGRCPIALRQMCGGRDLWHFARYVTILTYAMSPSLSSCQRLILSEVCAMGDSAAELINVLSWWSGDGFETKHARIIASHYCLNGMRTQSQHAHHPCSVFRESLFKSYCTILPPQICPITHLVNRAHVSLVILRLSSVGWILSHFLSSQQFNSVWHAHHHMQLFATVLSPTLEYAFWPLMLQIIHESQKYIVQNLTTRESIPHPTEFGKQMCDQLFWHRRGFTGANWGFICVKQKWEK